MTSPVSNIPERINTPRTNSAPAAWNTPAFHVDRAMVAEQLRNGVAAAATALEDFLAFLAGPAGNRVLTYDRECQEAVKQMICGLPSDLSESARAHLNRIRANQGWNVTGS